MSQSMACLTRIVLVSWLVPAAILHARQASVYSEVVPGVRLAQYVRPAIPVTGWIVEVALKTPGISIGTALAQDHLTGRELTSAMAGRASRPGRRVVAALNADFFTVEGNPTNMQVQNFELVRGPTARSVFFVDSTGTPGISRFTLNALVSTKNGKSLPIHSINEVRRTDRLVYYNHFYGSATGTNQFGTEVLLAALQPFRTNRQLQMRVVEIRSGGPTFALQRRSGVLSGHGSAGRYLKANLAVGDTVRLAFRTDPGGVPIAQAVGGLPRLVRDGLADVMWEEEGASMSFAINRHPRSALGYSAGRDTLYLVAIDGRQPGYSLGYSLSELAKLMVDLGCDEALNLDGGGSTTLVVQGGVRNRPSDATGERAVANTVMVYSESGHEE